MRDERSNFGVPDSEPTSKRCSGCGRSKPTSDFYRSRSGKLSSRCKDCQCQAARTTNRDRRSALQALIAAHDDEYRALLAAERSNRAHRDELSSGGDSDVG
jgi:recombinational DNA repair protein (RecF pathway)